MLNVLQFWAMTPRTLVGSYQLYGEKVYKTVDLSLNDWYSTTRVDGFTEQINVPVMLQK